MNSYAHGHVHELMGGSWGQKGAREVLALAAELADDVFDFVHSSEALSKVALLRDICDRQQV